MCVTGLSVFEILTWSNEWIYQIFDSLNPQTHKKVLIIEASAETPDEAWFTLLTLLKEKKAKQIVFTFMPKNVPDAFYCHAEDNVFFARFFNSQGLAPLPKAVEKCKIQFGLVSLPPQTFGIYSKQYSRFQINKHNYPALEVLAAQQFLGKSINLPNNQYHINFSTGLENLPKIKLERILVGGLINDLVEQRSVVIGFAQPRDVLGLYTPLTMTKDLMISLPQYHALALNTLLNEEYIMTLNIKMTFLLLLILMVISTVIYWGVNVTKHLHFTLSIICLYLILAWLLFHYTHLYLPLVELFIAQILLYWINFKSTVLSTESILRERFVEISFRLGERSNPRYLSTSDEHWSQIIVMVNQILNLNRLIFLERIPEDHRVREVKALHCSLADIEELRRDYERWPYSQAIIENRAIRLNKPYLKAVDFEDEQYLVPLKFAGAILGFWAFSIKPERATQLVFAEHIKNFADQIGELLYYRQQWLQRNSPEKGILHRYLHPTGNNLAYKALDTSIIALEHRLLEVEELLYGAEIASILYNSFGQVIQINQRMEKVLKTLALSPNTTTILEFLMRFCDIDMSSAQQHIRRILLEKDKMTLPVTLPSTILCHYILNIRAFSYQESLATTTQFSFQGILCELIDITEVINLHKLKEEVAEQMIFQLRNDLQSINLAMPLLAREELSGEQKHKMIEQVRKKMDKSMNFLEKMQSQLSVEQEVMTVGYYPIDAKKPIQMALENLHGLAAEQRVELHSNLPALISLVFASPQELRTVLITLLTQLIHDSLENTKIIIQLKEREDHWISYICKNTGFGLPNEHFQRYLFGDVSDFEDSAKLLDSEKELPNSIKHEFNKIRSAIQKVQSWGGTVTAFSEIGQGMSFELRLKSFLQK